MWYVEYLGLGQQFVVGIPRLEGMESMTGRPEDGQVLTAN